MKSKKFFSALAAIAAVFAVLPMSAGAVEYRGVDIHGFVSQGYLYTGELNYLGDTKDGTWEYNEMGVNFQAQPLDRLRLGVQFFSRDLGELGNNRIEIDWALADYKVADELGLRAGILKTPHGLSHDQIDLDMTRNTVFLPLATYDPRYRDLYMNAEGAEIYGTLPMGVMGSLDYVSLAGTNSFNTDVLEQDFVNFMQVDQAENRLIYGGRLIWNTPLEGLLVGGSFFKGEDLEVSGDLPAAMTAPIPGPGVGLYPAGTRAFYKADEYAMWYLFSRLNLERLTLTGEVYRLVIHADLSTDQPFNPIIPGFAGIDQQVNSNLGGWYGQADYQFTNWFAAAVAYSEKYEDWDDPAASDYDVPWTGFRRDTTISTRFNLTTNWNIKAEVHMMDGTLDAKPGLQEDPEDLNRYWNLWAVKTSYYF